MAFLRTEKGRRNKERCLVTGSVKGTRTRKCFTKPTQPFLIPSLITSYFWGRMKLFVASFPSFPFSPFRIHYRLLHERKNSNEFRTIWRRRQRCKIYRPIRFCGRTLGVLENWVLLPLIVSNGRGRLCTLRILVLFLRHKCHHLDHLKSKILLFWLLNLTLNTNTNASLKDEGTN